MCPCLPWKFVDVYEWCFITSTSTLDYTSALLWYTDIVKILSNAAARLKDNTFQGNLIGIGADFAKRTQEQRKELVLFKKHIQKNTGQERKVLIAYPATLKYLDENGKENIVRNEEF